MIKKRCKIWATRRRERGEGGEGGGGGDSEQKTAQSEGQEGLMFLPARNNSILVLLHPFGILRNHRSLSGMYILYTFTKIQYVEPCLWEQKKSRNKLNI